MSTEPVIYVTTPSGTVHLADDTSTTLCGRKVTIYWHIGGTTNVGYLATCYKCTRMYTKRRNQAAGLTT